MIKPHISIVSSLLPAGNNPNTLEGVVAHEFGDTDRHPSDQKHVGTLIFGLAYDSRCRPQWLWFRGRSKRHWIERVWRTYDLRHPAGPRGPLVPDEDMVALRRETTLTTKSWGIIIGMTLLLMDRLSSIVSADILSTDNNIGVPFILAFLTAFYTPQVGISCRTLTLVFIPLLSYAK